MTDLPTAPEASKQSPNITAASVRGKSTEALIQAIQAPGDEDFVRERARQCLALFYEPDHEPEIRAAVYDLFARQLRFKPAWAVSQAFDRWEGSNTHRPSPGHITKLADEILARYRDELNDRRKRNAPPPEAKGPRITAARAAEIMAEEGFSPDRMAKVLGKRMPLPGQDLDAPDPQPKHWTEAASDEEKAALMKARDENEAIQQSRRRAARKGPEEAA